MLLINEWYFKKIGTCIKNNPIFQVPEEIRSRNDTKKLDLEAELEQNKDAIKKLEVMDTD